MDSVHFMIKMSGPGRQEWEHNIVRQVPGHYTIKESLFYAASEAARNSFDHMAKYLLIKELMNTSTTELYLRGGGGKVIKWDDRMDAHYGRSYYIEFTDVAQSEPYGYLQDPTSSAS